MQGNVNFMTLQCMPGHCPIKKDIAAGDKLSLTYAMRGTFPESTCCKVHTTQTMQQKIVNLCMLNFLCG